MRVAVETSCWWNRRGFGRFVRNLLPELLRRNPDDHFLLLVDDALQDLDGPNVTVVRVVTRRRVVDAAVHRDHRSFTDIRRFRVAVKRAQPDVVFFPAVYSWFPVPRHLPSVVTFHDTIAHEFPREVFPDLRNRWMWNFKSRLAARQATRVLTVSESARRDVAAFFGLDSERVDVMSEAAEPVFRPVTDPGRLDAMRGTLHIPAGDYLLFVGGLSPHKNLTRLLDAMAQVVSDPDTGASLVIAGDRAAAGFHSEYEALEARLAANPVLARRVLFTGFVTEEDLPALYSGARALVMPSLSEGFGLPAAEAMACGTPVLASDTGALPETVGAGGLFFDPLDTRAMAQAMRTVLHDDALRARLARQALERAAAFSWARAADEAMASIRRCGGQR